MSDPCDCQHRFAKQEGGQFAPEILVSFIRKRWSVSSGIAGQFRPEMVVSLRRNMRFTSYIHPKDLQDLLERFKRALGGQLEPYEYRILRKDGTSMYVRSFSRAFAENGQVSLTGVLNDISERKQAEEALKKSEAKYRIIFNATGTAAMILEKDTTISLINSECELLSGYAREEIEGKKSWKEFFTEDYLEDMFRYHNLRRVDANSAPKQYETAFITRKGDVKQVIATVSMIPGTNQSIGFFLDINGIRQAEKATKQSKEKFRTLFEEAPVGIGISRAGKTLMVNQAFLRMFGYASVTDLVGTPLLDQIAPQCCTRVEENVRGREQGKAVPYAYESVGLKKDGSQFPLHVATARLELPDGTATIGYFTDITERKQAENELRFSEERFSKAFNDCPSPMSISTFPDGRYVDVNEAFLQVLGHRREEVIGFTRSELHIWEKPEDLARARQCLYEIKSFRNLEASLRTKSGALRIGINSADIIDIRGGEYILAVFEDITERKEAEEALRQSEERFFKAFHSSPCGMSITNLSDFRIIDVNQHWLDATGCSREEVVGKLREEIGLWTKQQCQQVYDLMAVYGSVTNLETVFRNKEGGERNCLWSSEIITLDDNQCLLTAIIDITERKQMDREMARLDRLNLMGQIAGSIAHEIRNPMTVVKGYLQLMQDKEEFASQKRRFDTMIGEIDRADAIITEFLSLAKIKPEEMKRQNINGIVDDLLPLIQADAAKRQVAISVELADVPDVNLDEKEIRQLFLNLVRNGIEAMPQLYGELMIKTFRMQDQVVLSIKDRGNGIPPEVLEKLGTPFFSTKEKGTGLGLPVCYRIAESHNARIEIETGKSGTTFMVRFPIPSPRDEVKDI